MWDFEFLDFINGEKLLEETEVLGAPLDEGVMSMTIHRAPRRLKIGRTMGDAVPALGRSILPGCKRATQLARIYTIQMAKGLATRFP